MQDLDELKHVFQICAEFEASSFYKENNFKPCLAKQLLNMFKLWCERGIRLSLFYRTRLGVVWLSHATTEFAIVVAIQGNHTLNDIESSGKKARLVYT